MVERRYSLATFESSASRHFLSGAQMHHTYDTNNKVAYVPVTKMGDDEVSIAQVFTAMNEAVQGTPGKALERKFKVRLLAHA